MSLSLQLLRRTLYRHQQFRFGHGHHNRPLCSVPPDNGSGSKEPPGVKPDSVVKKTSGSEQETSFQVKRSDQSENKQQIQQKTETVVEQQGHESKELEGIELERQQMIASSKSAEGQEVKAHQNLESSIEQHTEEIKVEVSQNILPVEQQEAAPKKCNEVDRQTAAKKKLSNLLLSLASLGPLPIESAPVRVQLSRPKVKPKVTKKAEQDTEVKDSTSTLGPSQEVSIEPELVVAAKDVAETLGGDVKATESELLSSLRSHAAETSLEDKKDVQINLSELFVGMKVERGKSKLEKENKHYPKYDQYPSYQKEGTSESDFRYKRAQSPQQSRSRAPLPVNFHSSGKLGIFNSESLEEIKSKDDGSIVGESILPVWDAIHERELKLSITHPPANAIEEMIQWTKQGKLWTFPIDNEIGLEEEKKVGFHEHIFLERHLEGWCPKRGPVRHFMELVCNGLSKNPYLTVERKRRHIMWYKDYFESKHETLKAVGAV